MDRPLPPWPPGRIIRDLTGPGWHVRLDLGPQVLLLEIPEEKMWHRGEEALEPTCPNDTGLVWTCG